MRRWLTHSVLIISTCFVVTPQAAADQWSYTIFSCVAAPSAPISIPDYAKVILDIRALEKRPFFEFEDNCVDPKTDTKLATNLYLIYDVSYSSSDNHHNIHYTPHETS